MFGRRPGCRARAAGLSRRDSVIGSQQEAETLAIALLGGVPLPPKATIDAYHISVAAVHGVEFLVTWNCKHIANPALRARIEFVCRQQGYEPPVICTPQELLEINDAT